MLVLPVEGTQQMTMSLIEFCEKGDLEEVKAALQSGANVNAKDKAGWTGLISAVRNNHNSVAALLLETPNIDVNLKSETGWSPLLEAVMCKNNDLVKLLLKVPNIDVNSVNIDGWSALHQAVYSNNIEGLKMLLNAQNIDVNIVDGNDGGWSALHLAVEKNNNEGLKLLLSHPGLTSRTVNHKTKHVVAPVMLAVKMDRLRQLAVLATDPRVDLDTTDLEGRSLEDRAWWARSPFLGEFLDNSW